MLRRTLREKPRSPVLQMFSQIPAVSKIIISFDQFNFVSLGQVQFVWAASYEVVYIFATVSSTG